MPSYLTPLVLWCPIYIVVLLFIQRYNDRKLLCQVMAVQQMCIIMSHIEGDLIHKLLHYTNLFIYLRFWGKILYP